MGESSCVTCGECVAACPTGALTNKPINNVPIRPREELRQVDTVCPYCGVGCALTFNVDDERERSPTPTAARSRARRAACASRAATAGTTRFSEQRLDGAADPA